MTDIHYYLDQSHPDATDAGPGSEAVPFLTFRSGVAPKLNAAPTLTNATTVHIAPGVYREYAQLTNIGVASVPTLIEAQDAGVVFSGSMVWPWWRLHPSLPSVYTSGWPVPMPQSVNLPAPGTALAKRCEQVFMDDVRLVQVLTLDELAEGTFHIDDVTHQMSVWFFGSESPKAHLIEVAAIPVVFSANARNDFTVRGVTCEKTTVTFSTSAAVIISTGTDVLMEDCVVRYANWNGFTHSNTLRFTMRDSQIIDCGGQGGNSSRCIDSTYEDVDFDRCNWRGAQGDFFGWSVAGFKHTQMHGATYRRVRCRDNQARGFWFDYDCMDMLIEDCEATGNHLGFDVEACQGPVAIRGTLMANNSGLPINSGQTENLTLEGIVCRKNAAGGLSFGGTVPRAVQNYETLEDYALTAQNLTLRGNVVDDPTTVITVTGIDTWKATFTGEGNLYRSASSTPFKSAGSSISLAAWRTASGQESTSRLNGAL